MHKIRSYSIITNVKRNRKTVKNIIDFMQNREMVLNMNRNEELLKKAYESMEKMKPVVQADYYRLEYHIMPPAGLLNDPNGFIHMNGEYHLFYQLNPFDTKHASKHWGHVKSKDLVNWSDASIALVPSKWYETHGCYSGSAVNDNGVLTIMYTGNVKDEEGNRETYQCLAMSKDGMNFEKYENNPVINNQPEGYTRHFRDPKVWKNGHLWYAVLGTQTIEMEGRVLLFKSENLKNWELIGEVTGSNINGLKDFGYMWECPDLFHLDGKDVLIACPQGLEAKGDLYNNIYQSGYFIGKLNYDTGKMEHGEFVELDRGFEFYAPQTTIDDKERRILIGWMGLPERDEHPTVKHGWLHTMTIPRVLQLKGEKLYQNPVEEMKSLRKEEISYNNMIIDNEEIQLENIQGDVLELYVEFELNETSNLEEIGIKVRCSKDNEEYTRLCYDLCNNKFILDRDNSGKGYKGIRKCKMDFCKKLKLNIFMDTSSIEIFINDGEEVFTSRIYPEKNSRGIKFFAKGGTVKINKVVKWNI